MPFSFLGGIRTIVGSRPACLGGIERVSLCLLLFCFVAVMSLVEQRSMFTMWAALPGPLILSADLRKGMGGLDVRAQMRSQPTDAQQPADTTRGRQRPHAAGCRYTRTCASHVMVTA